MTFAGSLSEGNDQPVWIDGLESWLCRVEGWVCVAALAVMLIAVSVSVAVRYFNFPLPNVAEWAIVAMAPLTFVGAAMCSYTQTHISVDVIKLLPSIAIRRAARVLVATALLAFSGVYAWLGYGFFMDTLQSGERMLDMGTPVAVSVFFLLLGMVLMLFHGTVEMWRALTGREPIGAEESA